MSDTEKTGDEHGGESSGGGGESSTPAGGNGNASGSSMTPKNLAYIIYGLFAAGLLGSVFFLPFVAPIVGVILCYMKRDEFAGTWMESHLVWLIRTFWISAIAGVVLLVMTLVTLGLFAIVGLPLGIAVMVWYIYRLVKGFLAVNDQKPIADPEAYI